MANSPHKRKIDCLIIGCNQMIFATYVDNLRKMGEKSGAFRDLNLSFYEEDRQIRSCSDFYNNSFPAEDHTGELMNYNNIFSATISYLGSFLHKHNMSFAYINSFQEGKEQLKNLLEENEVLTIAITTTYYVSVLPVLEIMEFIKATGSNAKIVLGGPFVHTQLKIHTDASFRFLLDRIGADFYVISSQGEQTLVKIISALHQTQSFGDIPNIIYKTEGNYCSTALQEEDNNLSENIVNWRLFADYLRTTGTRMVMVRTAKSCPFSCTFCSFPAHAGAYKYMAPEELCQELDVLNEIETINSVTFIDDTFNVPLRRYKEILRLFIQKKYRFQWNCNFRCQYADEESVQLMKEAGCVGVFLGIESGSDTILKNMNKSATTDAYRNGIALLKKYGIITYASFILGFPGETEETVRETIDFIETTQPDFFRAQLWYYDTMTPIHKESEKYGLQNSQFEWKHKTMDSVQAANWVDYFHNNIVNSVWLPQNDFDFPSIFNLLSRGLDAGKIKEILQRFNERVIQKMNRENADAGQAFLDPAMLTETDFVFDAS